MWRDARKDDARKFGYEHNSQTVLKHAQINKTLQTILNLKQHSDESDPQLTETQFMLTEKESIKVKYCHLRTSLNQFFRKYSTNLPSIPFCYDEIDNYS